MIGFILFIEKLFLLPPTLLLAICSTESDLREVINHNDGGSASYGMCQIKLDTARAVGFTGTANELMNSYNNIYYAAKYLKKQLKLSRGNACIAISAYNMGRVKYVNSKIKNPTYVLKVFRRWRLWHNIFVGKRNSIMPLNQRINKLDHASVSDKDARKCSHLIWRR